MAPGFGQELGAVLRQDASHDEGGDVMEKMESNMIGHNNPPSAIDEALAPYGDFISEAENWLDGQSVTSEEQMRAVDAVAKQIKAAEKAVGEAKENEAKPLHDQWKAALARYKPTLDDLDRMKKGLAALVSDFKRKLAAEKAEAERLAAVEAARKRREAEEALRQADAANIEAQRAAQALVEEARAATEVAKAAKKDAATVKGLRTVTYYEITNAKALLHFIARNHKDDMQAFIEEWARRNHKAVRSVDGLRVWDEKEAF